MFDRTLALRGFCHGGITVERAGEEVKGGLERREERFLEIVRTLHAPTAPQLGH